MFKASMIANIISILFIILSLLRYLIDFIYLIYTLYLLDSTKQNYLLFSYFDKYIYNNIINIYL